MSRRVPATIHLMGGDFASQPLAFAHLLDASEAQTTLLDFDHIEVLQKPFDTRLAHWHLPDPQTPHQTLIAFLPGSGGPLQPTQHLETIGAFEGSLLRP